MYLIQFFDVITLLVFILILNANEAQTTTASVTDELIIPLWNNLKSFQTCQSSGNYYFNSILQLCVACPTNANVDQSLIDGLGNYVQCICSNGYQSIANTCYNTDSSGNCLDFSCSSCLTSGKVSYSDRSGCVICDDSTLGISSSTNECGCALNKVLVESDQFGNLYLNKSCHDCPSGKGVILSDTQISGKNYKADYYSCQSCPDPLMTMSVTLSGSTYRYTCSCPSGYSLVGVSSIGIQSCIISNNKYYIQQTSAEVITYNTIGAINSDTLLHYFANAATNCHYYGGSQDVVYCQILANLCVLQLYDDSTIICATYQTILDDRGKDYTNNIDNFGHNLPWLIYTSTTACKNKQFQTSVNLNSFYLQYVLSAYNMNGTWLGYQKLETIFNYCQRLAPYSSSGGGTSSSTKWQIYGTYIQDEYSCELSTLLNTPQIFYELFLYDPKAQQSATYYPVPIRIQNMKYNGLSVNTEESENIFLCSNNDVLVRRFFLYDVMSGLTSGGSTPQIIRYASKMSIEVSLTGKGGDIYSPVFTIQYTEQQPNTWSNTKDSIVNTKFTANYTMSMASVNSTLFGFFIAIVVLCGIATYLRYLDWVRRNSRSVLSSVSTTNMGGINIKVLIEVCFIAIHTWVLFFFPFIVLFAWFTFVFFKMQKVPSIMLPPMGNIYSSQSPYYAFTCMLYILAFFQSAYVCKMLYRQAFADVFLIDWEPLRTSNNNSNNNGNMNNNMNNYSNNNGTGGTGGGNKSGLIQESSVSVWRSILIANEWIRLQTMRKIDIKFTLFFLGIIFYYLGNDATQQPDIKDKSNGVINILLQFGLNTFWWLILSFGQFVWKQFIFQRCIVESPELIFLDLCTLAKISILVLDESYHGYYLHCRSPHQYSDASMNELIDMLHNEESGLTIDRSLNGAPNDVQTFRVFLTGELKMNFDKCYGPLRQTTVNFSEIFRQGNRSSSSSSMNNNMNMNSNIHNNRNGMINSQLQSQSQDQNTMFSNNNNNNDNPPPHHHHHHSINEKLYQSWKETTVFLQQFIENNFNKPSLKRIIREPNYLEKMFYMSPDMSINPDQQPSIFITDRLYQYTKVFWYGIEFELLLMNILTYCLIDLWFRSTPVSILICFLFDYFIAYFRHLVGKAVLSKKTLIDERFLI